MSNSATVDAVGLSGGHDPSRVTSSRARPQGARARINYFMNKFRKLGLIEYNGHIKVHSSLLNVVLRE